MLRIAPSWSLQVGVTVPIYYWERVDFEIPNHEGFNGVRPIPETTQKHDILMTYNLNIPLDLGLDYEFVLVFLEADWFL